MAYLYWDEGAGVINLLSLWHGTNTLVTRFANWTPSYSDVGDRAAQMSTGRITALFTYRTEYRVSFEMRNISSNGPTVDRLQYAQQLCRWMENGGSFAVAVEDDVATPDRSAFCLTPPKLTLTDAKLQLYTLSVSAVANTGGAWIARYSGARP